MYKRIMYLQEKGIQVTKTTMCVIKERENFFGLKDVHVRTYVLVLFVSCVSQYGTRFPARDLQYIVLKLI